MNGDVLERNRNLNRGFRKLDVWREGVELYAFMKQILDNTKEMSFKIKDQVMSSVFSVSSNTRPVK
jgi:hypothetical protein